jgi:ATP-binding cassette subfamily B protein
MQEPFLLSDTLAENIAFGTGAVDDAAVRAAAEVAGIAEEIARLPDGFATRIGERGITLSGGQRQRTALARAIARAPQVLLLDDALSAVDTETEARILSGLKRALSGRTVLLTGHRVSTLRNADHIVVLEHGQVVEQGTHPELLARGGHYARLDELQRLASALEAEGPAAGERAAS